MTVTLNATPGVSGANTFTFGCSGTSGTGSNCIDFKFAINTVGTYGTTASLATCGANTLQGSAAINTPPAGICMDSGVGEFVNGFRIGATQNMWSGAGTYYYDGLDPIAALWSQSAAFTCNVVAVTVVQCVKGPVYSGGLPSSIGQWLSSGTYASYGDSTLSMGRVGSLIGYPGGQSLGFTAGSGYTNGTYTLTGSSCGQATAFTAPKMDVTVIGRLDCRCLPLGASDERNQQRQRHHHDLLVRADRHGFGNRRSCDEPDQRPQAGSGRRRQHDH